MAGEGFDGESEVIAVLKASITSFAEKARHDGSIPVVYLANGFGREPFLYETLKSTLQESGVIVLSSHEIAATNNPENYLYDGHFTDEIDDMLAIRLVEKIRTKLAKEQGDHGTR